MENSLFWAHSLVNQWFISTLGYPTEPQRLGWPHIIANQHTLISSPTGSGKTLAAFLICIDKLVRKAITGTLKDETQVLYVSPLKAVSTDIQKNLMQPLAQIQQLALKQGIEMQPIRVAVRTGDTPPKERLAMLKKPPHIIVTTPESLYILLTAEKSRYMLQEVNTVIIDEIHAVAQVKRGAHLSLSLERLQELTTKRPLRIGLSATQKPMELIARFLVGNNRKLPQIIDIGHSKHLELQIEVPKSELGAVASNDQWEDIYDRIAELTQQNRTTLIFANTRRIAERTAHHLATRLGADQVLAHHGSLSRKLRLAAETQLKNGTLKALVATASLELGIDIGTVDLVCQLGSPRSISVMLQRVGRSGHWHGAISKGCIFVTTRDELLECAALVHAIRQEELDQLIIPEEPLDILAQQLVACCATRDWYEKDLWALVKKSYPYRNLTKKTFETLIEMLSDGIAASRGRYGAYIFRDTINGIIKARRGSRLTAITNGGAIPETALFTVIAEPAHTMVGTLDEDFAIDSHRGDIILLGSTSWNIRRIDSASGRVLVEDAHGSPPNVPFWRGEAPARTKELSQAVSELRHYINSKLSFDYKPTESLKNNPLALEALAWLKEHCKVNDAGSEQIAHYILQGRTILGAVPTQKVLIAERFFDESGGMQLIIHSPFGSRINKAWGFALRKCFCRNFNFELQAAATENGINISLTEHHSFPLKDVFHFLHPNSVKEVLIQAILQSPLFTTRWRWDAGRALALPRFRLGKKIPPNIQRMRSEDLLAAVFPDAAACQDNLFGQDIILPDHPLINETMKDCLTEALDFPGLLELLNAIRDKSIQCLAVDTPTPSVFSHEILNANPYAFLDDAPLEERRARAVEMRRMLPSHLLEKIGQLDPNAIATVVDQAWPDVRNADELHDVLQSFIAYPANEDSHQESIHSWRPFLEQLIQQKRAGIALVGSNEFWYAREKTKTFSLIYPQATYKYILPERKESVSELEECIYKMLLNWISHLGPTSSKELSDKLVIERSKIDQALLRLESAGTILRGTFKNSGEQEWCDRRLLARIHQYTLGLLRQEIKPIGAAHFFRWLLNWQHVAPGTQLSGEQGLLAIIEQLQGFEIPAKAWESQIFAKRLEHYEPIWLDKLCLMGVVGWGRLSLNADAKQEKSAEDIKKITPSSVIPITFFLRDSLPWLTKKRTTLIEKKGHCLSHRAELVLSYLQRQGASFYNDMVHEVHLLKSEIEMGLWELVAAGLVTADAFDNLRSLIDPRRRLVKKRRRHHSSSYSAGRWALLKTFPMTESDDVIESLCFLLLRRYGVVFRDLLGREKNLPAWHELLMGFRRLEYKGEIRGGRFVEGFLGEQFAWPLAVDSLRSFKRKELDNEEVSFSAVDPLNLVGLVIPGSRVMASSKGIVTLKNGMVLERE